MSILSAGEILGFAVHIEKDGYAFYTETAKKFNDLKLIDLFHYLAQEELHHEIFFKELQKEVGTTPPPESYPGEYKEYMADYLKTVTPRTREELKELIDSVRNLDDALNVAIGFEKDSVVFYAALKKILDAKHSDTLDKIIQEEVKHVLQLTSFKKGIGSIPEKPDVHSL